MDAQPAATMTTAIMNHVGRRLPRTAPSHRWFATATLSPWSGATVHLSVRPEGRSNSVALGASDGGAVPPTPRSARSLLGHGLRSTTSSRRSSACDGVGDPDPLDGQGNCSQTPKLAAQALPDQLVTDPTGSGDRDFLIMGDLNSYAMEDSIEAIKGQTKAPGVVSGGRFMHECW